MPTRLCDTMSHKKRSPTKDARIYFRFASVLLRNAVSSLRVGCFCKVSIEIVGDNSCNDNANPASPIESSPNVTKERFGSSLLTEIFSSFARSAATLFEIDGDSTDEARSIFSSSLISFKSNSSFGLVEENVTASVFSKYFSFDIRLWTFPLDVLENVVGRTNTKSDSTTSNCSTMPLLMS